MVSSAAEPPLAYASLGLQDLSRVRRALGVLVVTIDTRKRLAVDDLGSLLITRAAWSAGSFLCGTHRPPGPKWLPVPDPGFGKHCEPYPYPYGDEGGMANVARCEDPPQPTISMHACMYTGRDMHRARPPKYSQL